MATKLPLPDAEVLLPDDRVDRIVDYLRYQWPDLPDDADFTVVRTPRTRTETESGAPAILPEGVVFAMRLTNPRTASVDRWIMGRMTMDDWRTVDREYDRRAATVDDPAYTAFAQMVPNALDWLANMKALIN